MRQATVTAQRYFEVMDVPDETDGPVTCPASPLPCQAQNLAFSYDGQNQVLQDIILRVAQGQQVMVGAVSYTHLYSYQDRIMLDVVVALRYKNGENS